MYAARRHSGAILGEETAQARLGVGFGQRIGFARGGGVNFDRQNENGRGAVLSAFNCFQPSADTSRRESVSWRSR